MPAAAGMRLPDLREDVPAGDIAALVRLLSATDVSTASSMDLLSRAAGWDHVIAMAQAEQARVVGELVERREVGPQRAVDELQCALACTSYAAQRLVDRTVALAQQPRILDALRCGDIDLRKADAILDALPAGGDPRRWNGVVAAVLEDAGMWTAPELRRQAARLVIAAEPAEAAARCRRARKDRSVSLQPVANGMAVLSAYLPAPDAAAAFTVVDALAGTHRHPGDDRNVDQRRADAFAGVFLHILDTGVTPAGAELPRRQGKRVGVQVTVGAGTLLGLDELPGELAGYGPIPADMARELAQDGTWRAILVDPVTGTFLARGDASYRPGADLTGTVMARDVTCTHPYCGQPSTRCEIDHEVSFDPSRPAAEQTVETNLSCKCKHHHENKTSGGWTARRDPSTGASEWTDPLGITYTRLAMPIVLTAIALERLRSRDHEPGAPPGSEGDRHSGGIAGSGPGCSGGYPDDPPF